MKKITYKIEEIDTKPHPKSKYDPIINQFQESPHTLVHVQVPPTTNTHNLRHQLLRIIKNRNITNIKVSRINKQVYLEKTPHHQKETL